MSKLKLHHQKSQIFLDKYTRRMQIFLNNEDLTLSKIL